MAAKRRRPGTGSVRQLPSGRWQARYQRPGHGSWVTAPQTFDSKLEAQDRKAELERGGAWLGNTHFRYRIRSF